MAEVPDDLNVLGLKPIGSPSVRFGEVDVGFAARNLVARSGLNQLSEAEVVLKLSYLAGEPLDYFSEVVAGATGGQADRPLFVGKVIEAKPDGQLVHIDCRTYPQMQERTVGPFVQFNTTHQELVYSMARLGGVPAERINVEGLAALTPMEAFEIVVPLTGVAVTERRQLGSVAFLPPQAVARFVEPFASAPGLSEEFSAAQSFAVVTRVNTQLLDAEIQGLAEIDSALAWLIVRSRYGLALMPNGAPQQFWRSLAISKPSRGRLVLVRGMRTQRCWMRAAGFGEARTVLPLNDVDASWDGPDFAHLSVADRQALLTCSRAATEQDVLQRVLALWQAIEFYVSGIKLPGFEKAELKRVRDALPQDLASGLQKRLADLLSQVNEPSLRMKLEEAIRIDGVPVTSSELALLNDLRTVRNNAVHGRSTELPSSDDADRGASIVARMLLHRIARRRGEPE